MMKVIRIHPADNVAVALVDLAAGEVVEGAEGVGAVTGVPAGHKVALAPIAVDQPVIKYGSIIGKASAPIAPGEHVHSHNLRSILSGEFEGAIYRPGSVRAPAGGRELSFLGYRRENGDVGTRNEIWIIPTVGCTSQACQQIAGRATAGLLKRYANVEGIYAFAHPFGCSQLGDDLTSTRKILAGLISHANAAGVLVVGLGCENNELAEQLAAAGAVNSGRVRSFCTQKVGDEIEEGMKAVEELLAYANGFSRQSLPAGELTVGMKCGGSDGFSGITANPLVGRVADRLSGLGASVLLSEVPEMFGAESCLLERAGDQETFAGIIRLVNGFRAHFQSHNEPVDENPSPGNREGGITTLAEKSLGCVQKGGTAPVKQVLEYGQRAGRGLGGVALINGPGNDGVSGTALVAAGANLVLFTTGRGTPLGLPVPTVKISSNSVLAHRKPRWIDFDAGPLASGEVSFDEMAQRLLERVLDIASGRRTARNEESGNREIAIWKQGVTL